MLCAGPLHIRGAWGPRAEDGQVRAELWAACRVTCARGAEAPELPWLPSLPGKLCSPASSPWRNYHTAASFPSSFPELVISAEICYLSVSTLEKVACFVLPL